MKEKYYLITASEGEPYIRELSKKALIEELNEDEVDVSKFMDNLETSDMNYWGYEKLIIKGKIVTPEPVKTVTEYKIE